MYKISNAIQNYFYPNWPKSSTMEDWAAWHKEAKKRKFPYWMSRTMPSWFRVKGMQMQDVKMQFKYRLQKRHRYHLIDTKLGYGYHEIESRMLYGMFSMLVDFVEIEKASIHSASNEESMTNREAGLAHLDWEISLTHDEEMMKHMGTPELAGKRTDQAIAAQKIKDLYLWWVDVRPARDDPWDDEYNHRQALKTDKKTADIFELWGTEETPEDAAVRRQFWDKKQEIEDQYQTEDDRMMYDLVAIRHALWT